MIAGLKCKEKIKRAGSVVVRLHPVGENAHRHLKVTKADGISVIELLDGNRKPDLNDYERLYVTFDDDKIVGRAVKAMARIHFNLDDGENDSVDVDVMFIQRGFSIGKSEHDLPVWIRENDNDTTHVVASGRKGGLPVHLKSPAWMVYHSTFDNTVTVTSYETEAALEFIDKAEFQILANPENDVEIEGISLRPKYEM